MLFTGVSLKKARGFFPYESLTKWLFLYKLSFSWLELEHSVLCSFWGLTFLLISFNGCSCSQQDGLNLLAFPHTLSSIVLKITVLASGRAGGDHCVCGIPLLSFLPCPAFSTLHLPCGLRENVLLTLPKLEFAFHVLKWKQNFKRTSIVDFSGIKVKSWKVLCFHNGNH